MTAFRIQRAPIIPAIPTDSTPEQIRFFKAVQDLLSENYRSTRQDLETLNAADVPIGGSIRFDGLFEHIPSGFLLKDGSALSRTDYASLFNVLTKDMGAVTIIIASPGVVARSDHGFETGDCISFSTTGALPTGLTVSINYWIIRNDTNTFWLATSYENAITGIKINTSGSQSGIHSLLWNPWKISGASNFCLPDTRGLGSEGVGQQATAAWASAYYKGGLGHYKQDQLQAFQISDSAVVSGGIYYPWVAGINGGTVIRYPESDGTHGTPRTGYITAGPRVGEYDLIRAY